MSRSPDPLPMPTKRELTLGMSVLLLAGGYVLTRNPHPAMTIAPEQTANATQFSETTMLVSEKTTRSTVSEPPAGQQEELHANVAGVGLDQ